MSAAVRIHERLSWMREVLDPRPADAVLELGCGNGVLAALLLPALPRGHYLGLDRSPSAIAASVWRNSDAVASGAAGFRVADIAKAEPERRYDRIVAVNLNLFWTGDAPELTRMREWLAPHGRLYLAYQPPGADALVRIEAALRANLTRQGYALSEIRRAPLRPAPALCAIAGLD
ncbi:class I SAM-dependent methyltransferase [Lysobacter sp. 5GHs7-4]|uniref:class I SAM-dependent methyltransferase n=1 Tax=Lysobacter sp. 5GHs7-4 TaxID=2904253 RepID=UPI001E2BCE23|nr:class I SAM-dependent methyltransferase [Lysobacter sp. 5GHs7-4]UHQ23855.1 class I SAM-dependent methyltransferase [Lysobacter sp. 5GHs7-4]